MAERAPPGRSSSWNVDDESPAPVAEKNEEKMLRGEERLVRFRPLHLTSHITEGAPQSSIT